MWQATSKRYPSPFTSGFMQRPTYLVRTRPGFFAAMLPTPTNALLDLMTGCFFTTDHQRSEQGFQEVDPAAIEPRTHISSSFLNSVKRGQCLGQFLIQSISCFRTYDPPFLRHRGVINSQTVFRIPTRVVVTMVMFPTTRRPVEDLRTAQVMASLCMPRGAKKIRCHIEQINDILQVAVPLHITIYGEELWGEQRYSD